MVGEADQRVVYLDDRKVDDLVCLVGRVCRDDLVCLVGRVCRDDLVYLAGRVCRVYRVCRDDRKVDGRACLVYRVGRVDRKVDDLEFDLVDRKADVPAYPVDRKVGGQMMTRL